MPEYTPTQLGYFLSYDLWRDGLTLLNYQIERKRHNKHFNKLSMFYYEELGDKNRAIADTQKYYKERIANNLFYALSNEFATYPYTKPKSGLGLRNYVFMTYPMRALYYSIGLYLLKVSSDYIASIHKKPEIHSFYGGELKYDRTNLILKPQSVYYRNHYSEFRNSLMEAIDNQDADSVCLKLDIQAYFDSIRIDILLDLLQERISPDIKHQLKFEERVKDQIRFFMTFMSNSEVGIPQMDNGIISDLIGFAYLTFGDVFLSDIFKERIRDGTIRGFEIYRYVDDTYIFLQFNEGTSEDEKTKLIHAIGGKISDTLENKLKLKSSSHKIRYYRLAREEDVLKLQESIRRISPDEIIDDGMEDPRPPQEIADDVFNELRFIKNAELNTKFDYDHELGDKRVPIAHEVLKLIYNPKVETILNKKENKQELQTIFDDFNFELVRINPHAILTLICRPELFIVAQEFRNYLLQQTTLSTKEIDIILSYLANHDFNDKKLLQKLKQNNYMRAIVEVFEKPKIKPVKTGYFDITSGKILKLKNLRAVIEQIRQRIYAEKKKQYHIALNHLLNEIHSLCFELDDNAPKRIKNYGSAEVEEYLQSLYISNENTTQILRLFNQRHINITSHGGSNAFPAIEVTKEDYSKYRENVGGCLNIILQ